MTRSSKFSISKPDKKGLEILLKKITITNPEQYSQIRHSQFRRKGMILDFIILKINTNLNCFMMVSTRNIVNGTLPIMAFGKKKDGDVDKGSNRDTPGNSEGARPPEKEDYEEIKENKKKDEIQEKRES